MVLALWDWGIVLYRHFYRRKTSAFAGAGDGLVLRGGYSSASIVNYRQASGTHSCFCRRLLVGLYPLQPSGDDAIE